MTCAELGPRSTRSPTKTSKVFARRPMLQVGVDLGEQMLEQVDAAVDVSDDIGAITSRPGRPLIASRREIEHQDPGLAASRPARTSR